MIIAVESASSDLSVALGADDGGLLASDAWRSESRGAHDLLPRLLALLAGEGRRLDEMSAVAVGIGPGSFTGLRVGMSLAKGLALGLRRPIVGVPSLLAWLEAAPDASAALSRAGARDAYLLLRGEAQPLIVDRDELPARAGGARLVAPAELADAFGLTGASPPNGAAAAVATIAASRLRTQPNGDDLTRLEPAYLRAPRGVKQLAPAEMPTWP